MLVSLFLFNENVRDNFGARSAAPHRLRTLLYNTQFSTSSTYWNVLHSDGGTSYKQQKTCPHSFKCDYKHTRYQAQGSHGSSLSAAFVRHGQSVSQPLARASLLRLTPRCGNRYLSCLNKHAYDLCILQCTARRSGVGHCKQCVTQ
jgi:hypothetical protein